MYVSVCARAFRGWRRRRCHCTALGEGHYSEKDGRAGDLGANARNRSISLSLYFSSLLHSAFHSLSLFFFSSFLLPLSFALHQALRPRHTEGDIKGMKCIARQRTAYSPFIANQPTNQPANHLHSLSSHSISFSNQTYTQRDTITSSYILSHTCQCSSVREPCLLFTLLLFHSVCLQTRLDSLSLVLL